MVDNRLEELRKERNLSQYDIAKILDVSRSQIFRYESFENEIPIEKVFKLCDYFNVSLDYFYKRDTSKCFDTKILSSYDIIEVLNKVKESMLFDVENIDKEIKTLKFKEKNKVTIK